MRQETKNKLLKMVKELIPYLVIVIIVVFIRTFLVTPIRVNGHSMDPTLKHKEILLLKKYDHNFERFDIVVFHYQKDHLIKRVIGLPGETVEYKNNRLYINGTYIKENYLPKETKTNDFVVEEKIPNGYYFVLGDNRGNSSDSRVLGLISEKQIEGSSNFVLFPFTNFGKIKSA